MECWNAKVSANNCLREKSFGYAVRGSMFGYWMRFLCSIKDVFEVDFKTC